MYALILGAALFLAALCNAGNGRALLLVLLACCFTLVLPGLLPEPDALGGNWFGLLVGFEVVFASLALLIKATMSKEIAVLCGWNILAHAFGYAAYSFEIPGYSMYEWLIRGGEIAQALVLILFSRPLMRLALAIVNEKKGSSGGQFRSWLAAYAG